MRINTWSLACILLLPMNVRAESKLSSEIKARFVKAEIFSDAAEHNVQLKVDDKVLLEYSGERLSWIGTFQIGDSDIAIVEGTKVGDCPIDAFIVETKKNGAPVVTKRFGSCARIRNAQQVGEEILVRTEAFIPHPELLNEEELKRRSSLLNVYTWNNGLVRESGQDAKK